ncbi:hypothetical protein C0J52_20026 [Blattella germanica]|nr:hypothetical protein C0J52_20026 [Blattella germanica]
MTEVYQIAKGYPLETFQYGLWTQETGIALSSLSLYERRNNLNGFVFNASGITEPPLTVVKAINGTLEVRGFFGEVWKILETHLHFKTHLEEAQDNAYGSLDNGTWSGVIDMLINKEVEMGLGEFRVTSERLEVIDYTLPIILSRYQIYIREPTSQNMMWGNFLEPFSSELWLTVVASIVIFSIFCAIIFYANHQLFYRNESDMEELTIWDAIHIVFGAFCQQGYVITPRSNSCRMVLLCVYIIGAVLLAAYSAALVSFLAKRKPILPFNNLEELVTDGTYKFGLLQKSAEFNVFYGSKDKLLNETFNRFIKPEKENLPTSSQEGLTRTCQSKFAFFVSQDIAQGLLHKIPCKIIELPGDSFKGSVSMALIKNSPYRELINHYLLVLRKGGVLGRLRNNIWPKHFPDSTSTWITVDLHDVTPLLTVLAAGILVSFLLLLLEQIFYFAINDSQSSPFPWTL